ncbi:MAG TPA: hypothetical protein VES69_11000 [Pyrinomonadaceae bacterium]|nr:hypothetical protein [Pyrinomonadaceae bacterium]
MYCPRCSHEQGLEEMRFCSRCGFPMAGVAMLLENPGIINQVASDQAQPPKRRSRIIRESVFLTLLAWAIGLASTLLWDFGGSFESVAKVGSLVFFILGFVGLLRFLYAFLFVSDTVQSPSRATVAGASHSRALPENQTRVALPSSQGVPVSDYSPRSRTKEIVSQPSVTENTTRLLEDRDK